MWHGKILMLIRLCKVWCVSYSLQQSLKKGFRDTVSNLRDLNGTVTGLLAENNLLRLLGCIFFSDPIFLEINCPIINSVTFCGVACFVCFSILRCLLIMVAIHFCLTVRQLE